MCLTKVYPGDRSGDRHSSSIAQTGLKAMDRRVKMGQGGRQGWSATLQPDQCTQSSDAFLSHGC